MVTLIARLTKCKESRNRSPGHDFDFRASYPRWCKLLKQRRFGKRFTPPCNLSFNILFSVIGEICSSKERRDFRVINIEVVTYGQEA